MKPWILIDRAEIAGADSLRLMRRGDEFSIFSGRTELMNSRVSGSERAMATLARQRLGDRPAPHVLIGGLGMGFTLRETLAEFSAAARITVCELVPAVVAWARGPMAALFGDSLDDPRVALVEGDVGAVVAAGRSAFDAILLDVDNGPDGLTRPENDGLYGFAGLAAARGALRAGGLLAVWSAGPDQGFERRLGDSGFAVEAILLRAHGKGGARHVIWLATARTGRTPPARRKGRR